MATMEHPWSFGLSLARPSGCTIATPSDHLDAFPSRAAALITPDLQLCNPECEPMILHQRLTQHEDACCASPIAQLGKVPPLNANINPSELGRIFLENATLSDGWITSRPLSNSFASQQLIEAGFNVYRDSAEVCDAEQNHRDSSSNSWGTNLQESKPSERLKLRGLNMEDTLFAANKTETGLVIEDILLRVQQSIERRDPSIAGCLHRHICTNGLEVDEVVGNHLVPMFVECGELQAASQLFSKLLYRNEYSWSFLVFGYAMNGNLQHALDLFYEMEKSEEQPTSFTFVSLLKACGLAENLQIGQHLHGKLEQRGLSTDIVIGNCLVDMYLKCGFLTKAEEVFERLLVRDVISWTALLSGYIELDLGKEALVLYHKMKSEGVSANPVTFALAIKACKLLKAVDQCQIIHSEVVERGYGSNLIVCNSLLSLYSTCGCIDEARETFDTLQIRDVVSWNTLIAACVEHGNFQESLDCLASMEVEHVVPDSTTLSCALKACANLEAVEQGQELHITAVKLGLSEDLMATNSIIFFYGRCGLLFDARSVFEKLAQPDVFSWTTLISGYAEHSDGNEALECFLGMKKGGILANAVTYSCALKACGDIRADAEGREVHLDVTKRGLDSESTVANSLVSMYSACGLLVDASNVFERISAKCVVSWTTLIGAYTDWGHEVTALEHFEQMHKEGVPPNTVTFACTLKACGCIGAIDKGRELHAQITWDEFETDPSVGSALINMYARCGSLSEACDVFHDIPISHVSVWSAMIKAYAMSHEGTKAVECFQDMQQQHCKPDLVTFTCLLTACSHAGLIQEGFQYFKSMREDYKLLPTREHYCCMVDLLARSGDLFEAEKFLENFAPNLEDTWGALLSACKTHGELHLGSRCFQQLVSKVPDNASSYVLMSDICSGAGQTKDAERIEGFRKLMEAKKKLASAWIEIDNVLHKFVVGNHQNGDVLATVRNLNLRIKEEGHVPNLNGMRATTDQEQEGDLCEHAEKLAIAFGLLNTPQGTTLRISKNLKMCSDCHRTSKFVSKMEQREIILRDDCCMHRFKDGVCVCGDMF